MEMDRKKRDPKTVAIVQAILEQYKPQSAEDVNNAFKRHIWTNVRSNSSR